MKTTPRTALDGWELRCRCPAPGKGRLLAAGRLLMLGGVITALGGCAAGHRDRADRHDPMPVVEVHALRLFNGMNGSPMSWDDLIAAAGEADVIIIGELHGHPTGLNAAAKLWESIAAAHPQAALSMEFFERDQQAALDDYLARLIDEEEFRQAARRSTRNHPDGHRRIIETAREHGLPVYAANAPRRYVRLARIEGFDRLRALTREQRRLFVIPDRLTEGRYREMFFEMAGGHEPSEEPGQTVEDFFRSQCLWDATMADTVLRAVADRRRPVVHVVGRFHSDFTGGLVERIAADRSDLLIWTISMAAEWSEALREEDRGRADCVIYVGLSRRAAPR